MSIIAEQLTLNNSLGNNGVTAKLSNSGETISYAANAQVPSNTLSALNGSELSRLSNYIETSLSNTSKKVTAENASEILSRIVDTYVSDLIYETTIGEKELLALKKAHSGLPPEYPQIQGSKPYPPNAYGVKHASSYNPNEFSIQPQSDYYIANRADPRAVAPNTITPAINAKEAEVARLREKNDLDQTLLGTQQSFKTPLSMLGANQTNLISSISGSDLSVFFLADMPNVEDVVSGLPQHLWRKEMMLIELDSVMSFTYSIVREVFPVRAIGTSKPKSYTRGPIGIAGGMTFSVFAEDVLVRLRTQIKESINKIKSNLQAELKGNTQGKDEFRSIDNKMQQIQNAVTKEVEDRIADSGGDDMRDIMYELINEAYRNQEEKFGVSMNDLETQRTTLSTQIENSRKQTASLMDTFDQLNRAMNNASLYMLNQLVPFSLLVMGTNEQGVFSKMMLKGVRIIDENQMQGVQQPNIVNKVTFAAEDMFPLMTGAYTTGTMDFTTVSSRDQNNPIDSNPYATYTGSQLLKDVISMKSDNYRLGDK